MLWKVLINLSVTTFSFIVSWIHFYIIISRLWFHWFIVKSTNPIYSYFVWFAIRLIQGSLKASLIVITFLYFIGITHTFLLQISVTHNDKRNPLLHLLTIGINARSAPQILSLKDKYTLHFSNFAITVLCSSLAYSLLDIFSGIDSRLVLRS